MKRVIILHTNDMHARLEGFSRIITLIEKIRAENPDKIVLYFDAGDAEDTTNRLSNITKGHSIHRILRLAKPEAIVVGNASVLRYSYQVLENHAHAVGCPLLLANLLTPEGDIISGLQPHTILTIDHLKIGVIGITAPIPSYNTTFGMQMPDTIETVKQSIRTLQNAGCNSIIILSHLGYSDFVETHPIDPELVDHIQGQVDLVIGGHTHDMLPNGEKRGDVWVVQAKCYAEYLGRVDAVWDGDNLQIEQASLIPITEDIPMSPLVAELENVIEAEVQAYLAEPLGSLASALEWSETQECGTANLMADVLRERMKADIGLVIAGSCFKAGLPAGTILRRHLWEASDSPGNPCVAIMTGAQLQTLIKQGLDPELAAETPRPLRGRARGFIHISGALIRKNKIWIGENELDPNAIYRVAGSDFELEPIWKYTTEDWNLDITYEVPTILREAVVDYLEKYPNLVVSMGRIER